MAPRSRAARNPHSFPAAGTVAFALAVCLNAAIFGQAAATQTGPKPNFSGVWKLNLAESDYSQPRASAPDSLIRTVHQTGDSLKYAVERRQGGRRGEYDVDLRIGGPPFESDQAGVVSATWEGDVLVVSTLFNPGTDRQSEQSERWTLSPDGRRVTDALLVSLPDGREVRVRRVFDKQ